MTEPKENEEINEELSTDELKSVSGGLLGLGGVDGGDLFTQTNPKGSKGNVASSTLGPDHTTGNLFKPKDGFNGDITK